MSFSLKKTRLRKISSGSHPSELYFKAFHSAIKNNIGRTFMKEGKPVIILDVYPDNGKLIVKYLSDEITTCVIHDAEMFFQLFNHIEDKIKNVNEKIK